MNDPAVKQCVASFNLLSYSPAARAAASQTASKKITPIAAAMAEDAQGKRIINLIADLTFITMGVIVAAYVVMKILRGPPAPKPPPLPKTAFATKPPPLPPAFANRAAVSPPPVDANN
jgi:hypothetical protein